MLACSLYAPHLARYIAYAHCRLSLPTHDDVKKNGTVDCGCDNLNPVAPAAPVDDKQKEISRNTDWKYLETERIALGLSNITNSNLYHSFNRPLTKDEWLKDIFHPPSNA